MTISSLLERASQSLRKLEAGGLLKRETVIGSRQGPLVKVWQVATEIELLNFCANNYLGLASSEEIIAAAVEAAQTWGAGTASVRFICGTLEIHKQLEHAIAKYLEFEDAILFAAAFDANAGVFEALLGEEDVIVSDQLNHASIIDGMRLCKARRHRYRTGDMEDLRNQMQFARGSGAREILIATDGVFSMDGEIAKLDQISQIAAEFGALVLVDDSHATGVLGPVGRGSASHFGVKADIVTGTFGKALGGSMGGFICAAAPIVDLLRQRARPYLFSNSLVPAACGAALRSIEVASSAEGDTRRSRLFENVGLFRESMVGAGFQLRGRGHPIVPVMIGDARVAQAVASHLREQGILAPAFSYPVVPNGQARIRIQLSSAHEAEQIVKLASAFELARELATTAYPPAS